ncbi:MAG: KpsF/GutQ family sugar-phosphate isomerase [Bryobacterales bacterium]|nr:KpsF/GutQ family sugar-phosphate isomerase [Bryobacterales bacterium]
MNIEAEAIGAAAGRLNGNLACAVRLILNRPGKVVVSGIGKSGHVGRKLAATLSSTGTPAVFLHPAEAVHGDLGICAPGDPAILISRSGATAELLRLAPELRELGCPLIGIIGNPRSALVSLVDAWLDASVDREADPLNLAPTASAAVTLALGHGLAAALMQARHFTVEQYGRRHPGGQLGRYVRARVREAMHAGDQVAWAAPGDSFKQVVMAMTRCPLGAACVVAEDGSLLGLITDGDVRRTLERHDDIRPLRAADVMTAQPVVIGPEARLLDALRLMENRRSQIAVLPVVESGSARCLGLIRVHDICQAGLMAGI